MNVTIVHADAFKWLEANKPEFILTDAPHWSLEKLSKLVEKHRLQWINASSPRWLTEIRVGEKIVEPYRRIIGLLDAKTICDPFMGWGTTGFAAVGENRDFIGVDHQLERCQFVAERFVGSPHNIVTVGF